MSAVANPYLVVIEAEHPIEGSHMEHRVRLDAYSVQEAVYQAIIELEAKHALSTQQYKLKILSIGPDTEQAALRLTNLLQEIGLLRMPSKGSHGD